MKISYKDLMDKLGVGYEMGPYETYPWSAYDDARGITCSAEVRVGPEGAEVEAEIQMMYDTPPAGKPPMEQICAITFKPCPLPDWDTYVLRIRGEKFGDDIYNWQEKACNFFRAIAMELQDDIIPDIDDILERELHNRERKGNQSGSGGGKSPKIEAGELLNMKQRGGF
ncbi:MAG TPA: hypothetical protein EYG18_09580 [Micavibrio sp.]|nr:hypothetical protein [Micavibrio sp.]HIL29507.1 hypothetical protein [Micavibrio sp.]